MKEETRKFIGWAAIILPLLLIIAIFLPGFLTSKIAAQETSAMISLQSLYDAEVKYRSPDRNIRYGSLQELAAAGLIDSDLANGEKNGYRFEIVTTATSFEAHATPLRYGHFGFKASGRLSFFMNEKRVLTNADKKGARAGPEDEPVG